MRKSIRNFVALAVLATVFAIGAPAPVRAEYVLPYPSIVDYEIIDLEIGGWIIEITTYSNGAMKVEFTQLPR
jgi:hypothetical protein